MTDQITPKQFHEAEGVADWRVVGDGACAHFRTGSLAAGARLVQAISELPGVEDHGPDVDVRGDAGSWACPPTRRRSRAYSSSRARALPPR